MNRKFNYTGAYVPGKLHYLTSGHPSLVSKFCRIMDEKLSWQDGDVDIALSILLKAGKGARPISGQFQ